MQFQKDERNWRYNYINEKTESDQSFLKDYHDIIPNLYYNKAMNNEELDNFIY